VGIGTSDQNLDPKVRLKLTCLGQSPLQVDYYIIRASRKYHFSGFIIGITFDMIKLGGHVKKISRTGFNVHSGSNIS